MCAMLPEEARVHRVACTVIAAGRSAGAERHGAFFTSPPKSSPGVPRGGSIKSSRSRRTAVRESAKERVSSEPPRLRESFLHQRWTVSFAWPVPPAGLRRFVISEMPATARAARSLPTGRTYWAGRPRDRPRGDNSHRATSKPSRRFFILFFCSFYFYFLIVFALI